VLIVIAVGATGNVPLPASLGALAAGRLVVLLGLVLHPPLARVSENTLKFPVGVLLSAFGLFWIGEGSYVPWFGQDWVTVRLIKRRAASSALASVLLVGILGCAGVKANAQQGNSLESVIPKSETPGANTTVEDSIIAAPQDPRRSSTAR
jgi:hypothetical protein